MNGTPIQFGRWRDSRTKQPIARIRVEFFVGRADLVTGAAVVLDRGDRPNRSNVSNAVRDRYYTHGNADMTWHDLGLEGHDSDENDRLLAAAEEAVERLWPELTP